MRIKVEVFVTSKAGRSPYANEQGGGGAAGRYQTCLHSQQLEVEQTGIKRLRASVMANSGTISASTVPEQLRIELRTEEQFDGHIRQQQWD